MPALLPISKKEENTFTSRTMEHYFNNLYSNSALAVLSLDGGDSQTAGTETPAHKEYFRFFLAAVRDEMPRPLLPGQTPC